MNEHLRPDEVLLLYFAESYTADTQDFPIYWSREYRVDDPHATMASLVRRDYLRLSGLPDSLKAQTGTALKTVLKEHGQKTTGRKEDLVARVLESVPSHDLEVQFPQKWYVRTRAGQAALDDNPHIPYVHKATHLQTVDIYSLDQLVRANPGKHWRQVVWEHLNEQITLRAQEVNWGLLRNTKHFMATFLAEEDRWEEAIQLLVETIYYDLAIPGNSFQLDSIPILTSRISPYESSSLTVPPGLIVKLVEWVSNAGIDDDALREMMKSKLAQTHSPLPVFTREEVAQIVFLERDQKSEALAALYAETGARFFAAYEAIPAVGAGRTVRELS